MTDIPDKVLDAVEETLEFCAERAAFSHVHAKLARDILKTARKRDDVKVARDDHAPGLSSLVIGEPVEKVGGKYGGPGKLVARWTNEHGDEMNVVAHRIEGGYGMFKHVYPAKMVVPQAPREPEPAPAMSAETMREAAAMLAEAFDASENGLWGALVGVNAGDNDGPLIYKRDFALAASIRSLPLTAPKEG